MKVTIKPQLLTHEQSMALESPVYDFKLSDINIDHYIDSPSYKTVTAYTKQVGPIVLWEGAAYDAIGQWTDADVAIRLQEILSA